MTDVEPNMTSYDETVKNFTWDVPPDFNYTRDVVDAWARRDPDKLALLAVGPDGSNAVRHSFHDLSVAANRAARFLNELGVRKGDRVFVMLPRIPQWYFILLGCFKLGAIPMPATMQLQPRDIEYRIRRAEATVAITNVEGTEKVNAIKSRCETLTTTISVNGRVERWVSFDEGMASASDNPFDGFATAADDPMLIYFTSGTVAYPKMVLHTQASYGIGHDVTARFWQDLKPEDLHWTISDTGWAKAAWGKLFGQWRVGAAVFLWDARGKPDFDLILRLIGAYRVTTFCAPPTIYRALVLQDLKRYDFSSLRHCLSAGEPLDPETIKVWKEHTGTQIYDGYGQTETVNIVANFRCLPVKPGSMGKPVPGFDVAVVDDDGNVLPPGQEGHIAVRIEPERPVGLFKEYWHDPEATADAFRNGWYYTGDRAYADEDGYLWFVSRADDVIISAGYRIGPFEVESALVEHEAVAEAAVVAKPDPQRGSIVKAFVVLAPGFEPSDELAADIQRHVQSVTAPYKYPREIEFIDELPKTVSGKIRRVELREAEARRAAEG